MISRDALCMYNEIHATRQYMFFVLKSINIVELHL